jgi:hypothetical protein
MLMRPFPNRTASGILAFTHSAGLVRGQQACRRVLIRDPWGKFATQAVLCTDLAGDPLQIVSWFILRWQLEVTFREVRAHLGVETGAAVV